MLSALAPIFIIIIFGYLLKACFFPEEYYWHFVEKNTYYIFFPALLFESLSKTQWSEITALPMLGALLLTILILSGLLYAFRPWSRIGGPKFSSFFQGGIRFNSFIGIAGATALLGEQGLVLSAVALMGMIPLVNLLSVPTVVRFSNKNKIELTHILKEIVKNPLIIACIAGLLFSIAHFNIPYAGLQVFDLLGRAALPLGLLAVGAGLQINTIKKHITIIGLISMLKLVISPVIAALICFVLNVTSSAMTIALLFAGLPTASSAYILAKQLGGDHELMAATITMQTALAAITLPVVLYIFVN